MDEYVSTINPTAQYLSPTPMTQPMVPNVAQDNYLRRSLPFGIAPRHYVEDADENATTLPPAPRDNIDNNPACTTCQTYTDPFKRGDCYMLYSPDQNLWGKACGVKNINWVRGNRFGSAYEPAKLWNKTEYRVEPPAVRRRNPDIVVPTSDYPNLDYFLQAYSEYKDYPYVDKKECGLPKYTYPYDLTDPQARSVIEKFGSMRHIGGGVSVIILAFVIFWFVLRKRL